MEELIGPLMALQSEPVMYKNVAAFMLGLVFHIGQKMMENGVSLKEYMTEHGGRTFLSMSSLVSVFSGIQVMYTGAPLVVYFMGAYMIDNVVNKVSHKVPMEVQSQALGRLKQLFRRK